MLMIQYKGSPIKFQYNCKRSEVKEQLQMHLGHWGMTYKNPADAANAEILPVDPAKVRPITEEEILIEWKDLAEDEEWDFDKPGEKIPLPQMTPRSKLRK